MNHTQDYCDWTASALPDGDVLWETACGNAHTLMDGSPADNEMTYCCYCGNKIAQCSLQPNA